MCRAVILLFLVLGACVRPNGKELKTSDLRPHFSAAYAGGYVACNAYVTLKDDDFSSVQLEADAIFTCNGSVMTMSTPYYYHTTVPYVPGSSYLIALTRPVDGSSTAVTVTLP